ncbi:MAG TPA: hypothetical protein VFX59_11785 [Polyangiales bacterium]|nr:hypothetical protein [Polyangiales bacterium]
MNMRPYLLAALLFQACSSDSPTSDGVDDATGDGDGDDSAEVDAPRLDAGRLDGGRLDATTPPARDAGDAGQKDGGARDSSALDAAGPGEVSSCVAALKKGCDRYEKDTACGSVITPQTPLTAGGTWGGADLPAGPYGVIMDWNQGKDFANTPSLLEGTCDLIAGSFGEPAAVTEDVLDLRGADLGLYTVFRPACPKDGEKYPVITWGNGTCGQTGGYATLLSTLASHGFVVIASNSRFTGDGTVMLRALDFAKAANADANSPLYQRLDLDKVGAMGHSQGAGATTSAASDPRIKAIILWNGVSTGQQAKPFLAVSGDRDINDPTVASLSSAVNASRQPAGWLFYHQVLETGGNVTGHLTLMQQPERVTDVTINWWKYILNGDAEAKKWFVGSDCTLCTEKTAYEYGQRDLK